MRAAAALAWWLAALAYAPAAWAHEVTCIDPRSSEHLTQAVDAALMELQGTRGWFHGLRASSGYANALGVFSCSPDDAKWAYPSAAEAKGLLKGVLERGTLRVAGVQWSQPGAADYKTDPDSPTGFWPQYLDAVAETLGSHYGKTIAVERVYYSSSALVSAAVDDAVDVDMSEPYYYLSGFYDNAPRIEAMAFSCATAGTASKFFTAAGAGVSSTDELFAKLESQSNRAVGFIGKGNYDAVAALLPEGVSPVYVTNSTEMALNVAGGSLVAGYVSEGEPPAVGSFDVFETGIISPRVALFRKERLEECTGDDYDHHYPGLIAGVVIVALVALVLAVVLAYVVAMERRGSPLFAPLLAGERPGEARA